MGTESEQLEQQARKARARLSGTIEELRLRTTGSGTPGQIVDQLADFASDGPVAEFLRNLAREARENPLPLTLIGIGVAWLIIASTLSARARAGRPAALPARAAGMPGESAGETVAAAPHSAETREVITPPTIAGEPRQAPRQQAPAREPAYEQR